MGVSHKKKFEYCAKTYDDVQTHTNACNAASRLKQNAVLGIIVGN